MFTGVEGLLRQGIKGQGITVVHPHTPQCFNNPTVEGRVRHKMEEAGIYVQKQMHVHMHTHMHACTNTHACTHVHTHTHTHTHTHIHTHTRTHTYTHTHTHTRTHTHVHVCIARTCNHTFRSAHFVYTKICVQIVSFRHTTLYLSMCNAAST